MSPSLCAWTYTPKITRWPLITGGPSGNYTTQGDINFTLVVLCTACGSSSANSATAATGNKSICEDFFAYESFIQSVKTQPPRSRVRNELQKLEQRLQVDGPTGRNRPLVETASRAVEDIKTDKGTWPIS